MTSPSPASEQPYRHTTPMHRVVAWISQRLFDNVTYTVNHGILKGMRRRGGLGWVPQWLAGGAETKEHEFFRSLDLKGKVVYDVGAFIGLFTMLATAKQAARVICYEPMDRNRQRLVENLRLNRMDHVTVRPFGVGSGKATLNMSFDPLMPGGASVSEAIAAGIRSSAASVEKCTINVTTLDADVAEQQLPAPDLIKIDIEGFELDALQGAAATLRACMPALYLEMHGETMSEKERKVAQIIRFLESAGYRNIQHVESGSRLTSANSREGATGHLYCTRD
jgi:FkbM family methyltransferase